jgi:hypothetical protein
MRDKGVWLKAVATTEFHRGSDIRLDLLDIVITFVIFLPYSRGALQPKNVRIIAQPKGLFN